jgi:hypothetical protein
MYPVQNRDFPSMREVRSSCQQPWDNCPFKISSGNLQSASSLTVKKYIGSIIFEQKNAICFKQKLTFTYILFTVGLIKKMSSSGLPK